MTSDPILSVFCKELQFKHECHTIILYGSRARGDQTTHSDYDLFGITNKSLEIVRDARKWNGFYLDAFIYPEHKISDPDQSLLHIRQGLILFQKDAIGSHLLTKLDALFLKGPQRLPEAEVRARQVWSFKMLDRIKADDVEGNYRRVWLLTSLLEDFFITRGQWYRGPKESLQQLRQERPDIYTLYESALKQTHPFQTCKR